jgi:hypothetical protein
MWHDMFSLQNAIIGADNSFTGGAIGGLERGHSLGPQRRREPPAMAWCEVTGLAPAPVLVPVNQYVDTGGVLARR